MELQLGELVDELTGRLSEGSVQALDELADQLDEVEERLERFKVGRGRFIAAPGLLQTAAGFC